MTRGEQAKNNFLQGYNCTQAVMLAFSDMLGIDEQTIKAVALPMGGGMGRLRQTCGGVSGAVMCLGLIFPQKSKNEIYALVQEFAKRFQEKNGSINCGELLSGAGVKVDTSPVAEVRTPAYYKKRPCPDLIADAADILEKLIAEQTATA
ncbi:MAG: C-GCAxxG-C-C family protein [Clostridia bacterium]|nr:C-GCAxxG-C-C family protein [Clostridia bacterium]